MTQPRTLLDKLWDAHEILRRDDGASLLWVDRHLVHEGSHHAFAKIGQKQIRVKEPNLTFGVLDHYVPTNRVGIQIDPSIPRMMQTLRDNAAMHGFKLFDLTHQNQGIYRNFAALWFWRGQMDMMKFLRGLCLVNWCGPCAVRLAMGTIQFSNQTAMMSHLPKCRLRKKTG